MKDTIGPADLLRVKEMLEANADAEPEPLVLLRRQAITIFGEDAVKGLPSGQVVRICGQECLIFDKWPMIPTR